MSEVIAEQDTQAASAQLEQLIALGMVSVGLAANAFNRTAPETVIPDREVVTGAAMLVDGPLIGLLGADEWPDAVRLEPPKGKESLRLVPKQPDAGQSTTSRQQEVVPNEDEDIDPQEELDATLNTEANREASGSSDHLRHYLRAIRKAPLLTAEQEVELAKRIEAGLFAEKLLANRAWLLDWAKTHNPTHEQWMESGAFETEIPEEELVVSILPGLEVELQQIVEHGRQAHKELVEKNLRWAAAIALRYTKKSGCLSGMDLIQAANIGLMTAIEHYDYRKGRRLATYSFWWIREKIRRAIIDTGRTIRLPNEVSYELTRAKAVRAAMTQDLGREPAHQELAKALGWSDEQLAEVIRTEWLQPLSIHAPVGEGDEGSVNYYADRVADNAPRPDGVVERIDQLSKLGRAIMSLPSRERDALAMHYGLATGEPMNHLKIAQVLGIGHNAAIRGVARALTMLQHPSGALDLVGYFSTDPTELTVAVEENGKVVHTSWRHHANCAGVPKELFFGRIGTATAPDNICSNCPVSEQCLKWAIDNNVRYGRWGGLAQKEISRLRQSGDEVS